MFVTAYILKNTKIENFLTHGVDTLDETVLGWPSTENERVES